MNKTKRVKCLFISKVTGHGEAIFNGNFDMIKSTKHLCNTMLSVVV